MSNAPVFDFKKARADAKKAVNQDKLFLIVLGHSGAGKSTALGTLGVKTLLLYGTRESHGPVAAQREGSANVEPMCIDYGTWPGETTQRDFTADESLQFISAILSDTDYLKAEGFKAVCVDGLPVMEAIVKESSLWQEKCKTAAGKHNTFKESEASQELLGQLIDGLKHCQQEIDCHVVVTGVIDVKEKDSYGAIVEAIPRLGGYGLCETLIQHFPDVVCCGKMVKGADVKYKFQFMADLTRTAKDEHGTVKKAMNFSPRLTGCETPEIMDADLSQLAKLKKTRKVTK